MKLKKLLPLTSLALIGATVTPFATGCSCKPDNTKVVVTIDLDGGTLGGQAGTITKEVEKGSLYSSLGTPTKTDFDFKGWIKDGTIVDDKTTIESDVSIKASWSPHTPPEPEVESTLCISDTGILAGFRADATKAEIEAEFGDTLTIPKNVRLIAPLAFVTNDEESTIPSTIKNFRFEDEYACREIGQLAFRNAPFENITITCKRNQPDGELHDPDWFFRGMNDWGLCQIDYGAFYNNQNLKYIKLPGSLSSSGIGGFAFACDESSAIETIDLSDWVIYSASPDYIPINPEDAFGLNPASGWTGTFIVRNVDGIYGPEIVDTANKLAYANEWRASWGIEPLTDWANRHSLGSATMEFWGEE